MAKKRILDLIVWIIMIIILVIFVYQLVNRVLGHSWQVEAFVIALMTLVLTLSFSNSSKISKLEGEFCHFRRSFGALAADFKELRKDFHEFRVGQDKFNDWTRVQFKEIRQKL